MELVGKVIPILRARRSILMRAGVLLSSFLPFAETSLPVPASKGDWFGQQYIEDCRRMRRGWNRSKGAPILSSSSPRGSVWCVIKQDSARQEVISNAVGFGNILSLAGGIASGDKLLDLTCVDWLSAGRLAPEPFIW